MGRVGLRDDEAGAVLVTVLLIVAVMASVSVAVMDDIRFNVRRTTNSTIMDQARWYALGAESFARNLIVRAKANDQLNSILSDSGTKSKMIFPMDEGLISASVDDANNCFNLNSVVDQIDERELGVRPAGLNQFQSLLVALDVPRGQAISISHSVADWIDSDARSRPGGAEDADYAIMNTPYRTGGTLLEDVTELRAISGVSRGVYDRIRPFVCVYPNTDLSQININALKPGQGVLFEMILGNNIRALSAEQLIEDRPLSGYSSLDEFWAHPLVEGFEVEIDIRAQLVLFTRYIDLAILVEYQNTYVALNSLLDISAGQKISVLSRRWGEEE